MRKIVTSFFVLSFASLIYAQSSSTASTSAAPIADTPAVYGDTFADVAALGQEIALAQRKIQALTLKNNLDQLEAQQEAGDFSLKVIRVLGFGNTLYAVLTDSNGVTYQVGPGDMISKQYRVTLLRPYAVGVVDTQTERFYSLPFVKGEEDLGSIPEVSATAAAATNAEAPASASSSGSATL